MRQSGKWLVFAAIYALGILTALGQSNHTELRNEVYSGYGIFSFYKLPNPAVYNTTKSTGMLFAGYNRILGQGYSIGIIAGYEKIQPTVKNSTETFFVKRTVCLARINKVLVHEKNYQLYISILGGICQEDQHLIDASKIETTPVYDFVFVGLKYWLNPRIVLFTETGYNQISLLRCGFNVCF